MTAAVRSLVVGSVVEVVAFFCSIPKDSTQPETGFQLVTAYTQAPGMFAFFRFGELIGELPAGIAIPLELLNLAAAFLIEAGLFALPFWFVARWWDRRAVRSRCSGLTDIGRENA